MYFSNFPQIVYDFNINGKIDYKIITDITKNVRFRKTILENIALYDYYDIRDGETPEIISEKIYGTSEYHWVIMLLNQRYDYVNDFPLTERELEEHIDTKYGDRREMIHHYSEINDITKVETIKEGTCILRLSESETTGETVGSIAVGEVLESYPYGYYARVDEILIPSDNTYVTIAVSMREGNFIIGTDTVRMYSSGSFTNVVDITYPQNQYSTTNAEYERNINETKRKIKIIDPTYMEQILKEFEDLL